MRTPASLAPAAPSAPPARAAATQPAAPPRPPSRSARPASPTPRPSETGQPTPLPARVGDAKYRYCKGFAPQCPCPQLDHPGRMRPRICMHANQSFVAACLGCSHTFVSPASVWTIDAWQCSLCRQQPTPTLGPSSNALHLQSAGRAMAAGHPAACRVP